MEVILLSSYSMILWNIVKANEHNVLRDTVTVVLCR